MDKERNRCESEETRQLDALRKRKRGGGVEKAREGWRE